MSTQSSITILKANVLQPKDSGTSEIITFDELKTWVKNGSLLKKLRRYEKVHLKTCRLTSLPKPLLTAILLSLLGHGDCIWEDEKNNTRRISIRSLLEMSGQFLRDWAKKPAFLRRIKKEVNLLSEKATASRKRFLSDGAPVYFRTDMVFGLKSGGSIGHIAGVLNNLPAFFKSPTFFTSDLIPTVDPKISTELVSPDGSFWDFPDLPSIAYNDAFYKKTKVRMRELKPSFIYQRYSTNNYSGVKFAEQLDIPLVIEYNGSEIWINRHWGKPLKYERLSEKIELLNLRYADLIVVVSKPMLEELIARGIEENKILVNPNGVNPDKYSPSLDATVLRNSLQFGAKTVLGFIGTFGKWHGAETLVEAFAELLKQEPSIENNVRLMLIGDGMTMPQVKAKVRELSLTEKVLLTGIVPQEKGPQYLAACDILVSPHVPNPDGTAFFGSPTKLFEYMAMGKGIVASDLDQIGEILRHMDTAYMVKPGSVDSLVAGMKELIQKPDLRNRLGEAARNEAVAKYTWKEHTHRIISKLRERCG